MSVHLLKERKMTSRQIDSELVELAELAIGNAYYFAFSQLAANFQAVGVGLNEDRLAERLSQMSSLYSSQWESMAPEALQIATKDADGKLVVRKTLLDALRDESAVSIELLGKEIFQWKPPVGWYFVG